MKCNEFNAMKCTECKIGMQDWNAMYECNVMNVLLWMQCNECNVMNAIKLIQYDEFNII